ncbi:ABC transporter ATP-binding protein [Acidipropionibacterium jensenii]|uniref:ABC transporter ATP-binding protein n=1 Tax=Acidipropionibacterium jensenii TaxID=1749 RepID=A0A3T0S0K9_9ACTN|nr:ABC transporter ATP-binding protein [Acidipropionibacterium jensenii]AZZ39907.1 ABC transporter ATP-binding protein [Acidipropionibacterium jensenii]
MDAQTPVPSGHGTELSDPDTRSQAAQLKGAEVTFGDRVLWHDVDLTVHTGEFVAVLGPNGAGKTTMLRVLLGQIPLSAGTATVAGHPVTKGSADIGYVPQQRAMDTLAPIRGRDLVTMGVDGHRWGPRWPSRARRRKVDDAIRQVGATSYAEAPISQLSGGEQQRLRIAQALVTDPALMLCDEPLLSLDIRHQDEVTLLIDQARRAHEIGVLFVTHEINPVLPYIDRVAYVAGGRVLVGTPDEVMRSETLSELYGSPVQVFRRNNRIVVLADEEHGPHEHGEHQAGTRD